MKVRILVLFFITNAAAGMSAPTVCRTPACARKGADIKGNMDTSADPCDNFFQFACGGWTSRQEVPEYSAVYGQFQALDRAVKYNMTSALSIPHENASEIENLLYKAHSSCMLGGDEADRDDEEAWNEIMHNIGVEDWPDGAGDVIIPLWSQLLGDLMVTFNHKPILYVDVSRNHDTNKNIIHVRPGSLPVKREYLHTTHYKEYIHEVIKRINTTSLNAAKLVSTVDQMVNFEMTLAEIFSKKSNESDSRITSVGELEGDPDLRRSMVNVYHILNHTFTAAKVAVGHNDSVLLSEPGKVRLLLKAFGEWEKHIVSNVLVWHALQTVGVEVIPSVRELNTAFKSKVRNVTQTSLPQTLQCNAALAKVAPAAYSHFYVNKFFDKRSVPIVKEMVKFQQSIFRKELQSSDWMDEKTKAAALSKLAEMSAVVGYPQWIMNETALALDAPNPADVGGERFVCYYAAFARQIKLSKLRSLRKEQDPAEHEAFNAAMVNAYCKWTENKIYIPAGIMQQPFFDAGLPKYINYAILGYIVFHEITHGFDSHGRLYDKKGRRQDWWTAKTAQVFRDKAECFVNQYGNITDAETQMKLPSSHTLGEDISDNASARQSYLAFQALMQQEKDSMQLLPGLESYTFEQLHFIGAAQPWCKKYDLAKKKLVIEEDVHSVSEQRVNVALGNTPQFAAAFKCPPESKMNFAKTCRVW
ncbi:neprilysin-1-like [Dermacentor albipictus]|uniref:neprilysin-1-like n=1 Tax=Dermacentor albipictus TaxID=60249 RepID=UPI0038FCC3FE